MNGVFKRSITVESAIWYLKILYFAVIAPHGCDTCNEHVLIAGNQKISIALSVEGIIRLKYIKKDNSK